MAAGPHDDERPDDPPADEPAEGAGSGDLPTSPEEVEARWREIVSQLDDLGDLAGPGAAGGPTQPSTALPRGRPGRPLRRPGPARTPLSGTTPTPPSDDDAAAGPTGPAGPAGALGPRSWSPDPDLEEAEDHFEPPEPDPVLSGDPLLTMAWTAVIGLPLLLLVAVLAWRDMPSLLLVAAGGAFLAGLGLLLWRMPHGRDEDDGPGAVV